MLRNKDRNIVEIGVGQNNFVSQKTNDREAPPLLFDLDLDNPIKCRLYRHDFKNCTHKLLLYMAKSASSSRLHQISAACPISVWQGPVVRHFPFIKEFPWLVCQRKECPC